VLRVRDLAVRFGGEGGVEAVSKVSLSLTRGRTLGVVGESGCGKTVTALAVMGLLPKAARIESGSVELFGRELVGLPDRALCAVRGD
jgi:ABC-type glutathione transport system ATPase component